MTFREGRHNSNGKNESLNNVPRAGKRRESGRRSKSRATTPRRHPPPSCHTRRRFRSRGTRIPLALSCCAKWISFLASCYFFFFFFFSASLKPVALRCLPTRARFRFSISRGKVVWSERGDQRATTARLVGGSSSPVVPLSSHRCGFDETAKRKSPIDFNWRDIEDSRCR